MKPFLVPFAATALLLTAPVHSRAMEQGTKEKPGKANLKPGEYVWEPEAASKGPVDIIVNLGKQQLFVYRDGVQIGRSTISSGSKGRETPQGIYMILQKNITHHSNKYHEASMPFMERLTWGGLAIHAGNTPGHPESHGCMHVPEEFAKKLYGTTEEGNTVLVVNGNTRPETIPSPNLLFADAPDAAPEPSPAKAASPATVWKPEEVTAGPYLVVFSTADKRVYVYRKGVEIGRAELSGPAAGHAQGKHVYAMLDKTLPDGTHPWSSLGSDGSAPPDFKELAKGWTMPADFRQKLRGVVTPGTTLVITDQAADNTKRGGSETED